LPGLLRCANSIRRRLVETAIEVTPAGSLTAAEKGELARCEAVIERGLKTFVEVGEALLLIRDRRLYRQTHSSFESYCRERWGMSKRRANQLVGAAGVIENLGTIVPVLPATESQCRPLAGLLPEEQREVWAEVVSLCGDAGITAAQVKAAVERKLAVLRGRPDRPTSPPLPAGIYGLVLADPPWRYDFSNTNGRAIEQHYPTMDAADIAALPVRSVVAPDAVLFLWATAPKLPEALRVMEAWGFTYKTSAVWQKSGLGMGYYFRVNHEILLVGTVGSPSAPPPSTRVGSVIQAPKSKHSAKPEAIYAAIEAMYPQAVRLELFSRRQRPGWTAWGKEAPC
jgi:N6-adenosine-specific RNA methylase IME4